MKLLFAEDEADLCRAVKIGLSRQGYAVDVCNDGAEALELVQINEYDLLILDLNLPGMDGMEILKTLRQEGSDLRVLILSARSSVQERIAGLDAGANDYLIKPFAFAELEARVRALLRREFVQKDSRLSCGSLELDTAARSVFCGGQPLTLTRTEFSILEYLMRNAPAAVSTETLMEHVFDSAANPFSNSVKVHIHALRKKIGQNRIINIRGEGYRIENGGDSHEKEN